MSLAISHGRLRRDETADILQRWQKVIKDQNKALIKEKVNAAASMEAGQTEQLRYFDRLLIDNHYRGMLEQVQEMIDRSNAVEVPITVFGFTVTSRSLSQGAFALGSVLATSLFNFVRESEDAKGMLLDWASGSQNETKTV